MDIKATKSLTSKMGITCLWSILGTKNFSLLGMNILNIKINYKNKMINKKELKKFLIENEYHTIENTEERLLEFVKGTMLNRK